MTKLKTDSMSYGAIKEKIMEEQRIRDLVDGGERTKEDTEKLAKGIRDIPVKKMMDQALYIKESLLPRVEKKQGKNSEDYIFFNSVFSSLLFAIVMADRFDAMGRCWMHEKVKNSLLRDQLSIVEGELQKFCTLEEIFLTDHLDRYADIIKRRAANLLK